MTRNSWLIRRGGLTIGFVGFHAVVAWGQTTTPLQISCNSPVVTVAPGAQACGVCPTQGQIFSVNASGAVCTVDPPCPYPPTSSSNPQLVTITCAAPNGTTAMQQCPVNVVDDSLALSCPNVTLSCGSPVLPQAKDACVSPTTRCSINPLNGTYSCSANTSTQTASCTGAITSSTVGPVITPEPGPIPLWPPNHNYRTVNLNLCATAVDPCTGAPLDVNRYGLILYVESNEPEDAPGAGDGATCHDIVVTSNSTVNLRAERDATSSGRLYTIHYRVTLPTGGATSSTCTVSVPHDQSGAPPAATSCQYCVGDDATCGTCPQQSSSCHQ
jgi:hypothetical protein